MIIYCDQLNWKSAQVILCILRQSKGVTEIVLLEPLTNNILTRWLEKFFRSRGIKVYEKHFYTGRMFWPDGESLMSRSLKIATDKAFEEAKSLLDRSKMLKGVNSRYPCQTIYKVLSRSIYNQIGRIISYVHLINFFSKDMSQQTALVMGAYRGFHRMHWPTEPNVRLYFYTPWILEKPRKGYYSHTRMENLKRTGIGGILCALNFIFRSMKSNKVDKNILVPKDSQRSILMIQDDEIDIDPSYRGQPHWIQGCRQEDRKRILIIEDEYYESVNASLDRSKLAKENIYLVKNTVASLWESLISHDKSARDLRGFFLRQIVLAMQGNPLEKYVLFDLSVVLLKALTLAPLIKCHHVDVFMSHENYKPDTEAVRIISDDLGVKTISFQYSNQGFLPPAMVNTAHVMMCFAPLFHQPLTRQLARPKVLIDVGYPYLSAVPYLKSRADQTRKSLLKSGATYIIGYFDENCSADKFGFCSVEEQRKDFELLYHYVLEDPTVALVVKTQFTRNLPEYFKGLEDIRQQVLKTGRYLELKKGFLRNRVLPAEAALISDIVIGHHTGATASLEAALVGKRSILVNSCGRRNMQDDLYQKSRLVYTSLEDVLNDVIRFREKETAVADLGDWTPIIRNFDPFNDTKVSERFVRVLMEGV